MKNNKLAFGFGLAFGITLLGLAFFSFVVGFVLAFFGAGYFLYLMFVFGALGVLTIICACFALKNPWPIRIASIISTLVVLGVIIYLIATGLFIVAIQFTIVYVLVFVVGVATTVLSILAKNKEKVVEVQTNNKDE